jgi:hypothetical protein
MGRRERGLAEGPLRQFAQGLWELRGAAGAPTYRALERRAGYSASALSAAAGGERLPTLAVTLAYVGACGGDLDAWQARWEEAARALQPAAASPAPDVTAAPPSQPSDSAPDRWGAAAAAAPLGTLDPVSIGPFVLDGRLGSGAMGQVYLGRTPGGRPVAVKVIHPGPAADARFRERFTRELDAVRRVQGLFTAELLDADPAAEQPWLATAYIPGPTLAQRVQEDGPLSAAAAAGFAAGVAEALAAIHAAGLVHRDLKPTHVILAPDGPRVIDFGIARAAHAAAVTSTGEPLGTAPFTAPELVRGEPTGAPADVFALGCLLAYALTGTTPFGTGASASVLYRIAHAQPDLVAVARADPGLSRLVGDCLAKEPSARPTPAEIVARLRPASLQRADRSFPAPTPAGPPADTPARRRRARSRRFPALLLTATTVVGVAAAIIDIRYSADTSRRTNAPTGVPAAAAAAPGAPAGDWTAYSGPHCASQGAAPLAFYDSPQAAAPWLPAASAGTSGFKECGPAERTRLSGIDGTWQNDADWVFTPPRGTSTCRFEIHVPPGSWDHDVLYNVYPGDASNGYNGAPSTSFRIDQARYDTGNWAASPAIPLTSGIVDLNITDAGADPAAQAAADVVRITCV